jgi:hypothetical protein
MNKTTAFMIALFAAAIVSAQDTLKSPHFYTPIDKETAAEQMILNVFYIKNNKNCTIEEFAQLVLGSKYAVYFPPSVKPLKEAYIKKFMKNTDFVNFKAEKVRFFESDAVYQKNHKRSSEQLLITLGNMGFNILQISEIMLETFKKHKLYVTYAVFKEIFQVK